MKKYSSIDISSVVDISSWGHEEEQLLGSRVKKIVSEPNSKQQFVFKEPKERQKAQIWSEIISSFIAGDLLKWDVQHAQIAIDNGQIGNLLKYIYNPFGDEFIEGARFCKHVDPAYDDKEGQRHSWQLIEKIQHYYGIKLKGEVSPEFISEIKYFKFWGRCIAFDALISNTDRHAENWAIMITNGRVQMAPLYDNATSMGCEVDDTGLSKWFNGDGTINEEKCERYAAKGQHHLRDGNTRLKLDDICEFIIKKHPLVRSEFIEIAELDLTPVKELLLELSNLQDIPDDAKMTNMRIEQILTLLQFGQNRVKRTLEEHND